MWIYRSLTETPPDFGPSALTIGNFDGVHVGHRMILRRLKALADERGWKASVLTFDPHPSRVVAPERSPRLMTSPEQRAALIAEEGIEQLLILPFTPELARVLAEDFVRELLGGRLGARAVMVGGNFRFGYRHSGNIQLLQDLGGQLGFETVVVPPVEWRGSTVSSSGIRELIRKGQVSLAARCLERAYSLEGPVVSGRGVGSKQTVPTLNLAPEQECVPASGVYVTHTRDLDGERSWESITNIGYRPTFGASDELSIETFLLGPLDGNTPRRIRVEFLWRVRDERKFATPEALRAQILKDVRAAENYFRRAKNWIGRVPCVSS